MELLKKVAPVFDKVVDISCYIACAIIFSQMILVSGYVSLRYWLDVNWIGLIESNELSLVYLTFLGATWVLRKDKHVSMDMVTNRLSENSRWLYKAIILVPCAIVTLAIVWYSSQLTISRFQEGLIFRTGIDIPDGYYLVVIPVSSFFLFVQFLRNIYLYFERWRKPFGEPATQGVEETTVNKI